MAMTNSERIARGLGLLRDGLRPKCEDTWRAFFGSGWLREVNVRLRVPERDPDAGDVAFLFKGMKATWRETFGHGFPPAVRALVFELADVRNGWAHQRSFTTDDTMRALDSMERVLGAFGNLEQRRQVRRLRRDLMRLMFDEESRQERRRTAARGHRGSAGGRADSLAGDHHSPLRCGYRPLRPGRVRRRSVRGGGRERR